MDRCKVGQQGGDEKSALEGKEFIEEVSSSHGIAGAYKRSAYGHERVK